MRHIMKQSVVIACALAYALVLTGCETMSSALDSTKNSVSDWFAADATAESDTTADTTATTSAAASPAPAVTAAEPALTPIRSDNPLSGISIADQAYADEQTNFGTPPVSALIPVNYHAPTPVTLAGGKLIHTYQLHQILIGKTPPLVINALAGEVTELIPGSVWLSGSGEKGKFTDDTQNQLGQRLQALTGGDTKRMLVFYCTGLDCWRSYNAALRAVNLGYSNVHWYRGGLTAWYAAGLPTIQSRDDQW